MYNCLKVILKILISHYPTVFLLDGNFYFPMMASTFRQYEIAGLLEPTIVVGIGYKSFTEMDSLRVRDYLYPAALPSDEIKASRWWATFL